MTDIHAVIAELRELEKKATPGEWVVIKHVWGTYSIEPEHDEISIAKFTDKVNNFDNASFTAAARNALPQLLDYVEKLEAVASAAAWSVEHWEIWREKGKSKCAYREICEGAAKSHRELSEAVYALNT